jgi:SPP1 gp7 family putative phage head morphogenesis protein
MKTILPGRKHKRLFSRIKHTLKDIFSPIVKATRSGLQRRVLEKSLDFASGLEWAGENPDKLLEDKAKTLQLYDTMMLDDRISSIVELKIRLALSVHGEFVPASDEDKDIEIKEWVEDVLTNMTTRWWDVLYNLLEGGIVHGFKVGEKIFDRIDGKIILRNIKFMHSMYFDFGYSEYGDLDKLYIGKQYGETKTVEGDDIANKFIVFVYPILRNGSYYGDSDLREIYPQYYAKYQIFRFRNIYLQNYGQPIPIITADSARVSTTEKNEIQDFVEHLQDNMYLYIPGMRPKDKHGDYNDKILSKFQIDLLENKRERGTDQYEKTIDQLDRQISRKLLVPDKMGFTQDATGARAQSQVFFDVLKMVIKDLHGRLEDMANDIIKQIVDLNFPGVEEYPTWQFEKIDEKIEQEMLKVLLEKGVVDKREQWIRPWTGIPELTEEEQEEIDEKKEEDRKKAMEEQAALPPQGNGFPPKPPKADKGQDRQTQKAGRVVRLKVDYKRIEEQYDTAEADFVRDFNQIHKSVSENVLRQVERKNIIENKDLKALKTLRISKTDFKRLLSLYYAKLYLEGKVSAVDEVKESLPTAQLQKLAVKPAFATEPPHSFLIGEDWLDRNWIDKYLAKYGPLGKLNAADKAYLRQIRDRSFFLTGDIEQRILKDVHTYVMEGLDAGLSARTIINQIDNALTEDRKKYATTIARTNASDAFNSGRMNFFMSSDIRPLIEAYQYSAIIDNVTTLYCESHDGQVIYPNDPTFGTMQPPNHFNCRSLLIPIMTGEGNIPESPYYDYEKELDAWGTGVNNKYRLPAEGFGGISAAEGGWK